MKAARTAAEARVIDHLLLAGWGPRAAANAIARSEAAEALERWVHAGLPFAQLAGGRAFDPAEVLNFAKTAGVAQRDDFWASRYVATGRELVREFGAAPRELVPRRVSLRLERRFALAHHEPGDRVRLRIPFPAQTPSARDLRIVDLPHEARTTSGYAEVIAVVSAERSCTLGAAYEFTAVAPHARNDEPPSQDDLQQYLRPHEGLVDVSARVGALAAELSSSSKNASDAVRAFWSFFLERTMLGVLHGENTLDAILDLGWFDCRLGSALFVALCRARGIPARTCSGFTLYSVPFYHYWAEAWLGDGWFPVDLSCWDLSLRGSDPEWRDYFFGALDYRMTVEVLPKTFTGFPSLRMPSAWYALNRPLERGAAFGIYAAETGALLYEDTVVASVNAGPLLP